MSIPGSASPLLLASTAAAGGYQVSRSLRFNSADSAYLSRTPAVAGNRKTWTWAGWVKRSTLGTIQFFLGGGTTANDTDQFVVYFRAEDTIRITSGATVFRETTQVFRDPSSWYHFTIAVDTTQSTANDRIKFYVNGTQVTTFNTTNNPTQNADTGINTAAFHAIGRNSLTPEYYSDLMLADIHFIDGQALTPSSFTEVSATTGQLIPKTYSGTYGTNGFQLKFADNSSNTATTLGKDTSGNSNNWTPNNLSVTAGAGNDSLVDTPTSIPATDTGVGGEIRGNYCVLNPLDNGGLTLANGNLDCSRATASWSTCRGTIGMSSGKWYWEVTKGGNAYVMIGIAKSTVSLSGYVGGTGGYAYNSDGGKYGDNVGTSYAASYTTNDVIGVAFDATAGTLEFYKNGVSQGVAFTGLSAGTYFPGVSLYGGTTAPDTSVNFGQRPFAYQTAGTNRPSADYKALCDTNLGAPLTAKPNTVMDVLTYTGNSTNRNITGLAFSPDLVWTKCRSSALDNKLQDIVRGATAGLISNSTGAETTDTNGVLSFNSDGYSLGIGNVYNGSGDSYVSWCWDAGTSTVSNTAGSITSQVRANASAGFSVVTYSGNSTSGATIGHGLGIAPSLIIIKGRNRADDWPVYHSASGSGKYLLLNVTNAVATSANIYNATPTSTVFQLGADAAVNGAYNYVAYCFSPVVGYSSALAWTGNGSADGPLLHCGFSPRFWIFKRTDTTGDWWMIDTARSNTGNPVDEWLAANRSDAEYPNDGDFDFLSNGIKIRTTSTSVNASGGSYIGFAWASNPFQYARAQ